MSKTICSKCGYAIQDALEMFCMRRKLHTNDGLFEDCHCFFPKSIFHHLAQSPEAMAAKLVYRDREYKLTFTVVVRGKEQRMGHECWRSTIIPGACWAEYDRAYAATVEKLKEAYNE